MGKHHCNLKVNWFELFQTKKGTRLRWQVQRWCGCTRPILLPLWAAQAGQGIVTTAVPHWAPQAAKAQIMERYLSWKQAQPDVHLPGEESKLIAVWLFNRTGCPEADVVNWKEVRWNCHCAFELLFVMLPCLQPTNLLLSADSSQNLRKALCSSVLAIWDGLKTTSSLSLWM